jgi:hypothetical protein
MHRIHTHLTFANVLSVIALFVALGGTAIASVIITSNGQVAQNTISGHKPPAGDHPNLITGTVNGQDLAPAAVTGPKLAANSVGASRVVDGSLNDEDIAQGTFVDFQADLPKLLGHTCSVGPITGVNAQGDHLLLTPSGDSGTLLFSVKYDPNSPDPSLVTCNPEGQTVPAGPVHLSLLVIDAH